MLERSEAEQSVKSMAMCISYLERTDKNTSIYTTNQRWTYFRTSLAASKIIFNYYCSVKQK